MAKKKGSKDKIIEAVYELVRNDGIAKMTMESVAEQAGLSKGGLFYHFPKKENLIEAMVKQMFDQFDHQINQEHEKDQLPGGTTRSYLKTTFLKYDKEENEFVVALLAALVNNPELLKPAKENYQNWQKQLENDQIDPVISTIVRLATDGLWFSELFGLAPIQSELRNEVFEKLNELVQEAEK